MFKVHLHNTRFRKQTSEEYFGKWDKQQFKGYFKEPQIALVEILYLLQILL